MSLLPLDDFRIGIGSGARFAYDEALAGELARIACALRLGNRESIPADTSMKLPLIACLLGIHGEVKEITSKASNLQFRNEANMTTGVLVTGHDISLTLHIPAA